MTLVGMHDSGYPVIIDERIDGTSFGSVLIRGYNLIWVNGDKLRTSKTGWSGCLS